MSELAGRLDNWARGMRASRRRLFTADGASVPVGSAEGRYLPEGGLDNLELRRVPKPLPPNMHDAWIVENAWKTLCVPETFRYSLLLRYHYCSKWEPARVIRTIASAGHGRIRDYQATLGMAHALIAEALERADDQNHHMLRRIVKKILSLVEKGAYKSKDNPTSAIRRDDACEMFAGTGATK